MGLSPREQASFLLEGTSDTVAVYRVRSANGQAEATTHEDSARRPGGMVSRRGGTKSRRSSSALLGGCWTPGPLGSTRLSPGVLDPLDSGDALPRGRPPRRPGAVRLPRETVRGRRYVGRVFSELLVRREQGLLSEDDVALALRTGRLGRVFFSGIREDVLDALVGLDIDALERLFDDLALQEGQVDEFFASDGTVRVEYEQATLQSTFGEAIAGVLRVRRR